MSSPDPFEVAPDAEVVALAKQVAALIKTSDTISDEALARLFAAMVRLYAARHEQGTCTGPFGQDGYGVTATDVMIATTAMLRAVNVQLFELGMWQAWAGSRA